MEDQIRELLASGMSAAEAASVCGVTVEKVQTLLKDQTFFQSTKSRGKELQVQRIEQRYLNTEETLLRKIEDRAKDEMTELPQMVRALEVVAKNRVAYRTPASSLVGPQAVNRVTLVLPKAADGVTVIMNSTNEIIAVGDRSMASMPLSGVTNLFKKIEEKGNVYENESTSSKAAVAAS